MMAEIQCRNCGKLNPPELLKCQFCQLPLAAMDDEDETIRPGQVPTRKVTAELEPILPQWLREAREKSRKAAEEEAARQAAEAEHAAANREAPPDLLAGLEAQTRGEDIDEVPDWLAGMQGGPPRASERMETYPRRQEIRWEEEPAEAQPEDEMGGLVSSPQSEVTFDESGLPSWITGGAAEKEDAPAPARDERPISPFDTGSFRPNTGELAEFLPEEAAPSPAPAPTAASEGGLPDWLSKLPPVSGEPASGTPPALVDTGSLDLGPKPAEGLPDWMANLDAAFAPPGPEPEAPGKSDAFDLPADLPDWMKSTGSASESKPAEEDRGAFLSPLPPSEETPQPPPISSSPAFFPGMEPVSEEEVGELFAAELPDWLSNVAPAEPKHEPQAADAPISPGDLPSWVQAMRPVESVLPEAQAAPTTPAGPAEQQGPLAGLSGILPIVPGVGPSKRPTSHSNMLQASEDQQSNAALLEKLLASETEPKPLTSSSVVFSQRVLRWTISIILLLLVTIISLSGSQVTPLPILPGETFAAINAVNGLSNDAPILIVFDYEPSLSGEVEAAAASLIDNLILVHHPRLTLLSTSLNGPALAEHFMAATQSQHAYLPGTNYVNLGYLPGGAAGVLGFAEAPRVMMPRTLNGTSVWALPPGLDIKTIADYAAVIVLTDQAESARVWIEQAGPLMNGRPMLMVTSAQAGPMIQPYVLSGQVTGMVSGLAGGASVEQAAVRPGPSRRYWDAFGLTMLIVVLMIFIGSAWNLVVGIQARARGEA
ncbi:MAG: hypothetical protein ACOYZ8_16925 [Chloroflexota bacterium]